VAQAIAVFLGREPGNSEFADVDPIARAGSLDVYLQGLVGDFDHFLEVVVRWSVAAYLTNLFLAAAALDRPKGRESGEMGSEELVG
jgi:hypothetical protein